MLCLLWNSRNFKGNYDNKDGSLNWWGESGMNISLFLSLAHKKCVEPVPMLQADNSELLQTGEWLSNQIGRENKPVAYSKFCQQVLEFVLGVKAHKATE